MGRAAEAVAVTGMLFPDVRPELIVSGDAVRHGVDANVHPLDRPADPADGPPFHDHDSRDG